MDSLSAPVRFASCAALPASPPHPAARRMAPAVSAASPVRWTMDMALQRPSAPPLTRRAEGERDERGRYFVQAWSLTALVPAAWTQAARSPALLCASSAASIAADGFGVAGVTDA